MNLSIAGGWHPIQTRCAEPHSTPFVARAVASRPPLSCAPFVQPSLTSIGAATPRAMPKDPCVTTAAQAEEESEGSGWREIDQANSLGKSARTHVRTPAPRGVGSMNTSASGPRGGSPKMPSGSGCDGAKPGSLSTEQGGYQATAITQATNPRSDDPSYKPVFSAGYTHLLSTFPSSPQTSTASPHRHRSIHSDPSSFTPSWWRTRIPLRLSLRRCRSHPANHETAHHVKRTKK